MKRFLRLTIFALVTLTIGLVAAGSFISYLQARFLVLPPRSVANQSPADYGISYQDVTIETEDGLQLGAWYVPPTREDGATFLFVHGHAGNRSHFLGRANLFAAEGYGMFFLDLRNTGESEGSISTMGLLEAGDVSDAFDFLIQQPEVNPDRIAIYGHSMGGATAIRAFARIPEARVLIAEAAYSSLEDNIRDRIAQDFPFPPMFFPQLVVFFSNQLSGENLFDMRPIDDIQNLDGRPVLLVHGTADGVVTFSNAERLFEAANEPKEFWVLDGVGHNSSFGLPEDEYIIGITPFLEQYLVNE